MIPQALVSASVLVVGVLLLSGVAKLLRPDGADEAFAALGVPDALRRPLVVRGHPWAEIALGLGLLALPDPAAVVAAVLALGLFTAYLVLVTRAVRNGVTASCHCFGSVGESGLSTRTVARNAVFVLLALLAVVDTATGGSVLGRLLGLGAQAWWLVAMALTGVTVALVLGGSDAGPDAPEDELPEEDYLRLPIPDVPVVLPAEGEVSLRDLAAERAQLLLFLSPSCGPCQRVTRALDDWARRLPEVDLRVLTSLPPDNVSQVAPAWTPYLATDPGSVVASTFGVTGRPQAVLLGRDGLLAGGPVRGDTAVFTFVDDMEAELAPYRVPAEG